MHSSSHCSSEIRRFDSTSALNEKYLKIQHFNSNQNSSLGNHQLSLLRSLIFCVHSCIPGAHRAAERWFTAYVVDHGAGQNSQERRYRARMSNLIMHSFKVFIWCALQMMSRMLFLPRVSWSEYLNYLHVADGLMLHHFSRLNCIFRSSLTCISFKINQRISSCAFSMNLPHFSDSGSVSVRRRHIES